jgi:hypothetical protein
MCKKFVCCVSSIAIIMAIVLGFYGMASVNGKKITPEAGDYKTEFTVDKSTVAAGFSLAGCIFGIVIGATGLCLCKWPNACAALIFGILAFVSGVIAFVAGGALLSGGIKENLYKEACETPQLDKNSQTGKELAAKEYGEFVDGLMCTDICPCDKTAYDKGYGNVEGTWWSTPSSRSAPQNSALKTDGTGYKSWLECYTKKLSKAEKNGKSCQANDETCITGVNAENEDFKNFVKKGGVEFIKSFETEYNCGSFCAVPKFYVGRSIEDGPPTRDCVTAFAEEYGDNAGAGAVGVVTGLILLMASFGAIPLCTGYSNYKEDE